MELGKFMIAVRSRSGELPRPESLDHAIATLIGLGALPGPQGWAVRRILGCLADAETRAEDISFRELAVLGQPALASLEVVIEAMLHGYCKPAQLRSAMGLGH